MPILQSGQQLSARYTVHERLSAGALGETWRASDAHSGREVVLKVLRPERVATPGALAGLNAEIEAARQVRHASLVTGYEIHREGDLAYLARDFVAGRDLSSLRGQPSTNVLPAVAQVAEALAAMHAAGLVHRDLKSSNVILKPDGGVCVIDLGTAAVAGDERSLPGGSPYNQSPQQITGEPPSPADDAYAFGALLYELLSGYPPFYPNVTRERVMSEMPVRLRAVHPVPESLVDLVMSLLQKDAGGRPQEMGEIAVMLRSLLRTSAGGAQAQLQPGAVPSGSVETQRPKAAIIRPIVRTPEATRRSEAGRPSWRNRLLVGGGMALLVAVVVGVFVALPRFAPEVKVVPRTPLSVQSAQKAEEPPVDLEQLAIEMDRAEQARGAFQSLLESLQRRGAKEWAVAPLAAGVAKGEEADRQFAAREYEQARENYKAGLDHLQQASDAAVQVLNTQLERGANALEAGQSRVAREAFALALRIDADNAVAKKGLKRSESLDKVIAALNAAANAEREQNWSSAESHYRQALQLDADTTAASEGMARMQARIAADEFAAAMSQGFASLNAGRLGEARATFQKAGALRPGAREVKDALGQVVLAERRLQIAAHRRKAEEFEHTERWQGALGEYNAALELDSSLEFAVQGRDRVAPRADLHRELDRLIRNPERLLTAAVREQARALLAIAKGVASPGPVLRGQVAKVTENLRQAETPVRVALESDNATQIAINRVGSLGTFARREVELNPGRYTVVGTRSGYRDVRRELTILPGQVPAPLVIRCEEPI